MRDCHIRIVRHVLHQKLEVRSQNEALGLMFTASLLLDGNLPCGVSWSLGCVGEGDAGVAPVFSESSNKASIESKRPPNQRVINYAYSGVTHFSLKRAIPNPCSSTPLSLLLHP